MQQDFGCGFQFKIIQVGVAGVEKSAILSQYSEKKFKQLYDPTQNVDHESKMVINGEFKIKLLIWDINGSELVRSIVRSYLRDSAGVLIVYDLTNRQSFLDIHYWIKETQERTNLNTVVSIVGCKLDLDNERQVQFEEGKELAEKFGFNFHEVSAKSGHNIEETYLQLVQQICNGIKLGNIDPNNERSGVEIRKELQKYRNSFDYLFKVVQVGDESVGKTCLLQQYVQNEFLTKTSIGCQLSKTFVEIDDQIIQLWIWDTAGQRSQLSEASRGCAATILIYSIKKRESFVNIPSWLEDVRLAGSPTQIIILIGNKTDLEEEREVSFEEGQQFAKSHGLHFFETSAKNYKIVEDVYKHTAQLILNNIKTGVINLNDQNAGVYKAPQKNQNDEKQHENTKDNQQE